MKNNATTTENTDDLRAENELLRAEIADLKETVNQLAEALRLAQHKRFGASSEKSDECVMEQECLFNEAEAIVDKEKAEEASVVVPEHTRRKKKEYTLDTLPEGIPVEIVEHRLPERELTHLRLGS